MSKHKLTDKTKKELEYLAGQMPDMVYTVPHKSRMKGEDLLRNKVDKVEGKTVFPGKVYFVTHNQQHPVNHKNRILSAFKSNGWDGVAAYVEKVSKSLKSQKGNRHEGAL